MCCIFECSFCLKHSTCNSSDYFLDDTGNECRHCPHKHGESSHCVHCMDITTGETFVTKCAQCTVYFSQRSAFAGPVINRCAILLFTTGWISRFVTLLLVTKEREGVGVQAGLVLGLSGLGGSRLPPSGGNRSFTSPSWNEG